MPMLLAGREPNHITRMDFLNWATVTLSPATARGDNECLTERMRMPGRPSTWLQGDAGALNQRRIGCLLGRSAHYRLNQSDGPFAEGYRQYRCGYSDRRDAMSMENRYFTSDLSSLS
jgi:hypothetical protein